MYLIITTILFVLASGPAFAQAPPDQYWQRLFAAKEAQSAQALVDLARQLDAANARLEELKKTCPDGKDK